MQKKTTSGTGDSLEVHPDLVRIAPPRLARVHVLPPAEVGVVLQRTKTILRCEARRREDKVGTKIRSGTMMTELTDGPTKRVLLADFGSDPRPFRAR